MKKQKSRHIRAAALALALAMALPALFSCGGNGGAAGFETEAKTDRVLPPRPGMDTDRAEETAPPIDEDDPDAEIKRLYYGAYNGTSEGALLLHDDVAYQKYSTFATPRGKSFAATVYTEDYLSKDLMVMNLGVDEQMAPFCKEEGCTHDVPWCVGFGGRQVEIFDHGMIEKSSNYHSFPLIVEPESEPGERRMYCTHEALSNLQKGTYGLTENWQAYGDNSEVYVLFEYDLNRGTRRAVLSTPITDDNISNLANVDLYYNGMIYCTGKYHALGSYYVLCADNETGKYTLFQYKDSLAVAGVYDGRIIIVGGDGAVFSFSANLEERKLIAKLEDMDVLNYGHKICGDKLILYTRRHQSDGRKYCLYMMDLSSSSSSPELELITESTSDEPCVYGKYVYYLGYCERQEYEFEGKKCFMACNGKLYRFDTETGVHETVYENFVVKSSTTRISYIDDESVYICVFDPILTEDTEKKELEHYAYIWMGDIYYGAQIRIDLESGKLRAYSKYFE